MKRMFDRHIKERGVQASSIRFLFEGKQLTAEDTAQDMQDGDRIVEGYRYAQLVINLGAASMSAYASKRYDEYVSQLDNEAIQTAIDTLDVATELARITGVNTQFKTGMAKYARGIDKSFILFKRQSRWYSIQYWVFDRNDTARMEPVEEQIKIIRKLLCPCKPGVPCGCSVVEWSQNTVFDTWGYGRLRNADVTVVVKVGCPPPSPPITCHTHTIRRAAQSSVFTVSSPQHPLPLWFPRPAAYAFRGCRNMVGR
jgi:hypothetical protein